MTVATAVQGVTRRAWVLGAVLAAAVALAPAAAASVTPSVAVTSTVPVAAGTTGTLGLDLRFGPSLGDSPDTVNVALPAGTLADAAIDGGACLTTTTPGASACQIGSGVLTTLVAGIVPTTISVNLFLVAPPAAGDEAGLAILTAGGVQVGVTDAITLRPAGSAGGVGTTLALTLPSALAGVPVSISELNATFSGLRFPTSCPATPADVTLTATSYAATTTTATAVAPLRVTGCTALAYQPRLAVAARRDPHDAQVRVTAALSAAAAAAPSRSAVIALAPAPGALQVSIAALHLLCPTGPATGHCRPIGTATAVTPDYPRRLTGAVYLAATPSQLALTVAFPVLGLTLVGTLDPVRDTVSFAGLPDIPLTRLTLTLPGGAAGLLRTSCAAPTATSTATFVGQGGQSTTRTARLPIRGCPPAQATH